MTEPARLALHDLACLRGDRLLFEGLDVTIEAGEALLISGANGAGKSSLLRVIAGLLAPTAGRIDCVGRIALAGASAASAPAAPQPRGEAALPVMERVALAARDCWFRGKDPAFRAFRLAPELDSHSGRPRILVVPAANPGGLPLLVVEGRGSPARIETFGPLLQTGEGARIARDVDRWAAGNRTCTAS